MESLLEGFGVKFWKLGCFGEEISRGVAWGFAAEFRVGLW